jgi:uncharacterized protein YgbK (DUF1537 family)
VTVTSTPHTAAAPPAPPSGTDTDALGRIREHNDRTQAWIVVLDDDPTGSQSVHDVTVLIDPTTDDFERAARQRLTTFVWTNTRSLPEDAAVDLNRALVRSALDAARLAGVRPVFVSRGDSTLRGHFAAELSAVLSTCAGAGQPVDGVVFAPAFLEAGRITADDVQWVEQSDGSVVPAAETEFARDATFGYRETNLKDWVAARTSLRPDKIKSIPAGKANGAAAERVVTSLGDGDIAIANVATAADLEALVLACNSAERAGRRLVYRAGPSLVRALAGQPPRAPLTTADLAGHGPDTDHAFGLTVVGSHTALTTRQLDTAARRHGLAVVELDVDAMLDDTTAADARGTVTVALEHALRGDHAALVTSRSVRMVPENPQQSLALARRVSGEVCAVVHGLSPDLPLRYLVAKGGITSHEVAVHGLGMRQASVLGQMLPGQISVLRLGPETPRPGMPYLVFPGNVGNDGSLADVLTTLSGVV